MSNIAIITELGVLCQINWGCLGVLIFLMWNMVEQGLLIPYLIDHAVMIQKSTSLFTFYGVTMVISSRLAGVLAEIYGLLFTLISYLCKKNKMDRGISILNI